MLYCVPDMTEGALRANLTIRPSRPEDDPRTIAVYNDVYSDMPPMSVEEYREWVSTRPPDARMESYVAEMDGEIVGSLVFHEATWVRRPNTYFAHLEVERTRRRQGVGSCLYTRLMATASTLHAGRVYATVREDMPQALEFAVHRGFGPTGRVDRMSRLDVATANVAGMEHIEARLAAEGIRIAPLSEFGLEDNSFLRAVRRMESETEHDIPSSEEPQPAPFERWVEEKLHGIGRSPHCFWVAVHDARPVGVARLRLRGERSATNGYTGVDRAYRGRGIAKALKRRTVAWARENGIHFVYTGNDVANAPMLAVNVGLGYAPLPAEIEVMREIIA